LNVINHAAQVAPSHVALDHDLALHPLARDEVRAAVLTDVGHRTQRDLGSGGGVQKGLFDRAQLGRVTPR
jgi:hypothetical protein